MSQMMNHDGLQMVIPKWMTRRFMMCPGYFIRGAAVMIAIVHRLSCQT